MDRSGQKILLVGDDSELLRTRARVVHTLGVLVEMCAPAQTEDCLERDRFELVILCNTMQVATRTSVADDIRRVAPHAYVLQLIGTFDPFTTVELPDHIDDVCAPEPDALLRKLRGLLRKQR